MQGGWYIIYICIYVYHCTPQQWETFLKEQFLNVQSTAKCLPVCEFVCKGDLNWLHGFNEIMKITSQACLLFMRSWKRKSSLQTRQQNNIAR